jgi:chemotaxis response regulator CheB
MGARTIGVVLSGTMTDGASGLMAVRAAGGRTIVQRPESALFAGMPLSAAATGAAEHVVEADEIGPLLSRLATDLAASAAPAADPPDEELQLGLT